MKTNKVLEGNCNSDVAGGLYREPKENLFPSLYFQGLGMNCLTGVHFKMPLTAAPRAQD